MLGRPWWRTGVNTEAKLLLLGRAFDTLGAVRVDWHTDIRNIRSQAAIERLGATREGVLRLHRQRPDGTWRDTVQYAMTVDEWPNAQARLRERLRGRHRWPDDGGRAGRSPTSGRTCWAPSAIILLPGPNSLFVLSTAAQRGVAAGYRAAAGRVRRRRGADVLSAAGVASLLKAYPPLFMVIKYAGAAYLAYVGVTMLRGAGRRWRDRNDPTHAAAASTPPEPAAMRSPFRKALVISLLNPKAILFFISFFIQFVDPGYAWPALSFLLLGLIAQVTSVLYLTALIFAGTFLAAQFRQRRRLAAGGTTAVAALFLAFSLKLATASAG